MPVQLKLRDTCYPEKEVTHVRLIARGIVLDEQNRVALHYLHRNDIFGDQYYLETPGGGVDEGESFEQAVCRECEEELGYRVEILAYLGEVNDFYNLIGRENHNRYFLCRRASEVGIHFASSGDTLIQETRYVPLEEAIALMASQSEEGVAGLVKQRELPILKEASHYLKNGSSAPK